MVTIGQVFENSKISDFFADPFISKQAKMEAIEAVDGLSEITVNLFGAMAENNRLGLVGDVAEGTVISHTCTCSYESYMSHYILITEYKFTPELSRQPKALFLARSNPRFPSPPSR